MDNSGKLATYDEERIKPTHNALCVGHHYADTSKIT